MNIDETRRIFSEKFKEARKNAGYRTQEDFAGAIGVGLETVRNWEQGRTFPEVNTLLQITDLLHCDLDFLFGRISKETHDLQLISEKTGLSSAAIKKIRSCDQDQIEALSKLIQHKDFKKLLNKISQLSDKKTLYSNFADAIAVNVLSGINDGDYLPYFGDDGNVFEIALLNRANTIFSGIISDITKTDL